MSFFITFEGIEGSGKTTQIKRLTETLRLQGRSVVTTREPGGCAIADAIRAILLDARNNALVPRAELLLYAAARAQHVEEVIRPALNQNRIVLCDRFSDATLAYQGHGRRLPLDMVRQLNALAIDDIHPHLTLLFDLPVETGLSRAMERIARSDGPAEDRFEQESLAFHQRIREGYLELARQSPERFRLIRADAPPQDVTRQVLSAVNDALSHNQGDEG
ncbi:dTMP kinase [Geoalkalibacter subterraneus]|uniref:Thymidylate kinase n=1 Tax=Geoalkalibacter subterraneus TaxID=483547 RepID=A0A0B5FS53_9BACT|nr:dTMP kinase [Geoalkalibacter subterraneus]AJF06421.1 thymidylate kinase [Geoalkalibacter subterraneus]